MSAAVCSPTYHDVLANHDMLLYLVSSDVLDNVVLYACTSPT